MTITKNLTQKLFIAAFIMATMTDSHQLNAMEKKSVNTINEADFQAYLLLSAIDNNHQCYLPSDLVQLIATNIFELIDKECYEKYKEYLNHPNSLLEFIENKRNESMSHRSIAIMLKRYLNYSGTSLGKIKNWDGQTVFHRIAYEPARFNIPKVECVKILCLVVENEAWDVICMKDDYNNTPLHCNWDSIQIINALLSAAPNPQKAWNLIITPNKNGYTVLVKTIEKGYFNTAKLLESYLPKEQ